MTQRLRGFTLLELMVVVAIMALASAGVSLVMRDSALAQLEREALRLSALLESARAHSRTSGMPVQWQLTPRGFRFVGLPDLNPDADAADKPNAPRPWLAAHTRAYISQPAGALALVLGPEPLIGAQTVVLQQDQHVLSLATDGLSPFTVATPP